jgi:hypothetical protein
MPQIDAKFGKAGANSAWFFDQDDGTFINVGRFSYQEVADMPGVLFPYPRLWFRQNVTASSCDEFTTADPEGVLAGQTHSEPSVPAPFPAAPSGVSTFGDLPNSWLTTSELLPADMTFNSGSFSRFSDRISLFLEEFTPSRIEQSTEIVKAIAEIDSDNFFNTPSLTQRTNIVTSFITRYDFVNVESLGTSNGSPNQAFTVSGSAILVPTRGNAIVTVAGTKWTRVTSAELLVAASTAQFFSYSATTGTVTFGNGDGISGHGLIPLTSSEIVLKITIRNGGGTWQYQGITVDPKDGKNIGVVKSVKNKVFYSAAEIAIVNYTLAAINSNLTVTETDWISDSNGATLATSRTWEFSPWASVSSDIALTDGDLFLFNAAAADATSPIYGVDTFGEEGNGGRVTEVSGTAGVKTTPKVYDDRLSFQPIVFIEEWIRYGVTKASDHTFLSAPGYFLLIHHANPAFGFVPVIDGATGHISPSTEPSTGGVPISPGIPELFFPEVFQERFDSRMLQVFDRTGTYAFPVRVGHASGITIFDEGDLVDSIADGWAIRVVGNSGTPYSKIVKWETHEGLESNKQYVIHITGAELPGSTCTWTASEKSVGTGTNPVHDTIFGVHFHSPYTDITPLNSFGVVP